ncbi:hypothetical protein BH10BAC5_BH10BAC5_01870 [soil metagenome]
MLVRKHTFFLFVFVILSFSFVSFKSICAQIVKPDTLHITPIDTLRMKNTHYLSLSTSDTISYSKYIWSDKRTLSEILNEESGFFEHFQNRGNRNYISYNNNFSLGVFRDGIQLNLPFVSFFDNELFSVNEIDKIEILSNISSKLYGIGNQEKTINVITKDVYNSRPFSQLRYSQDRYDAFDADFYISLPFSKKYKLEVGLNKYTIAGRYAGSTVDTWRGRGNLSFFPSSKVNFKLNFNYTSVDRNNYYGLSINPGDLTRDSFIDSVKNTSAINIDTLPFPEDYKFTTYSLATNLKLFDDPENTTKINLFYQRNSLDSVYQVADDRGISLTQNVSLIKNVLKFEFNGSYNFINNTDDLNDRSANIYQSYLKLDLSYKFIKASGFSKFLSYFDNKYVILGSEGVFNFMKTNDIKINFLVGVSGGFLIGDENLNFSSSDLKDIAYNAAYFEYGFEIIYFNNKVKIKHFNRNFNNFSGMFKDNFRNFNISFEGFTKNLDYYINYDSYSNYNITNPVKANLTYHDYFFNNHLNLHTGIDLKYFKADTYLAQNTTGQYQIVETQSRNNFLVDVFVGARIGHANINLTVANVFNNLVFDRYLFPYDNRGGLGNVLSRFTIVWDFIN